MDVKPASSREGPAIGMRGTVLAALALATIVATVLAWYAALETGRRNASAALDDELRVLARSVDTEIERFRYLPAVVGRDGRIRAALDGGNAAEVARANEYLTAVRTVSHADELYVMRPDGLTIAASNHAEPSSFVGQNYRFRPYFQQAVAAGEGRYYAVGVTTGIPGYFLASAIRDAGRLIGVAVVKVDMQGIEGAWRRSNTQALLVDTAGVVFLAGRESWKYRPLHPLPQGALQAIVAARKYDGIDLDAARPLFGPGEGVPLQASLDAEGDEYLLRVADIEPDGWRLIETRPMAPILANANLFALLAALIGMLACGAWFYLRQRRQMVRAKLDEHDRLERRVAERTAELNREIEERRRAEDELRQAQERLIETAKLAALGRMSAAIAHEVSQPLSALENTLATAGLLAERGDTAGLGPRMLAAREMARRLQRTVKSLRSLARKEPIRTEAVSVERSVAAALALAHDRVAAARVEVDVAADLHVLANAIRLEQVILNLLLNAMDALDGRPDPRIDIAAEALDGAVAIGVRDNGAGIPAEVTGRIAEPFFTTKKTGEGLGLGLSISRAVLDEFGGALTFRSDEGKGTTFTVTLPRAEKAREAAE